MQFSSNEVTLVFQMVKMHVTGVPALSLSLSHGLRNATPVTGTPQPVSTPSHPSRPGSVLGNMDDVSMLKYRSIVLIDFQTYVLISCRPT